MLRNIPGFPPHLALACIPLICFFCPKSASAQVSDNAATRPAEIAIDQKPLEQPEATKPASLLQPVFDFGGDTYAGLTVLADGQELRISTIVGKQQHRNRFFTPTIHGQHRTTWPAAVSG